MSKCSLCQYLCTLWPTIIRTTALSTIVSSVQNGSKCTCLTIRSPFSDELAFLSSMFPLLSPLYIQDSAICIVLVPFSTMPSSAGFIRLIVPFSSTWASSLSILWAQNWLSFYRSPCALDVSGGVFGVIFSSMGCANFLFRSSIISTPCFSSSSLPPISSSVGSSGSISWKLECEVACINMRAGSLEV